MSQDIRPKPDTFTLGMMSNGKQVLNRILYVSWNVKEHCANVIYTKIGSEDEPQYLLNKDCKPITFPSELKALGYINGLRSLAQTVRKFDWREYCD
jgi:hypothetical protein